MPRPGLRLRIALALALACLLVVGALGFTLYTASEEMEDSLIDQIVDEEMEFLVRRHQQNPGYAPQASSTLQSYIARSAAERSQLPDYLRKVDTGRHVMYLGKEFHVLVRDAGEVRYYVVYEVGLHAQREQEFKLLVLLAVLTAALVSLALGYLLSGVLVSQVTDLAEQVSKLRPGEPRGSLARAGQDPEVATLARAFDNYQESIELMIRREQEFTANASHELRTPLTAIQTGCELLLTEPDLSEKSRARVLRLSEAGHRMGEQIQALLSIARGQEPGEIEPVVLADCIAEAVEPYRGEISRKGLTIEVAVGDDAVLDLNHQALRFVLANLIRNAVSYTERGFVKIAYAAKHLTVADSGRGISAEHLPRIFERFFRTEGGATGVGLGLSIVKRICDHYGWNITVESAPKKGSTFSIVFP
jgi:signal transduction histidine kinase